MGAKAQDRPRRVLYGRKLGRRLRPGRQRLLDTFLPALAIDVPDEPGSLEPRALFPGPVREVWLEIGFGGGEHLAVQAAAHPDVGFIGCEPFLAGVAALLKEITERKLGNVRLVADDARPLLDALSRASIGRAFVLFPDPWPKARHHKRRLISAPVLDAFARILRDGAELRFATDHPDYVRWTLSRFLAHPAFAWRARGPDDWRSRPADWPETRYEAKAAARGEALSYLSFRRKPRLGAEERPRPVQCS